MIEYIPEQQSNNAIEEVYKLIDRLNLTFDERANMYGEDNTKYIPHSLVKAGPPINPTSDKQIILSLLDKGRSCPQIQSITKFDIQMIYSYKTRFWKKGA